MQWSDINMKPPARTLRQFGGLCIVFLGGLAVWHGAAGHRLISVGCLILALAMCPLSIWTPHLLRPLYVAWLMLVFPIGWSISNLILACIYFGVITPIGLVFRMANRDALRLRWKPNRHTYWTPKPAPADVRSYFRQF